MDIQKCLRQVFGVSRHASVALAVFATFSCLYGQRSAPERIQSETADADADMMAVSAGVPESAEESAMAYPEPSIKPEQVTSATTDCLSLVRPQPALKGSGSLALENRMADCHGLERIADLVGLRRLVADGMLAPVRSTAAYELYHVGELDSANAVLYQHARPWVIDFLDDVLGTRHAASGEMFYVTSLVRHADYQRAVRKLRAFRRVAASGATPDERSSHLTGATVDIKKSGMSRASLAWLRHRLIELEATGEVQATEERLCFHVMVFPKYGQRGGPR